MSKRAARLQEVAEHAGVAFITAWRALNEPAKVSKSTQDKVRKASEELGYVANSVARSLVSAQSGVVAVIVPTLDDSIFADTVQGIADVMTPAAKELLIGLSGYEPLRETELIKAFIGRQIDGLILTGRSHEKIAQNILSRAGVPIIESWDYGPDPLDMMVGFSSHDMAHSATCYLGGKGRRRIAFVSPLGRPRARDRLRGYKAALEELGLDCRAELIVDAEPTIGAGVQAFQHLMRLDRPPDAIFFNGDTLAIGGHITGSAQGFRFPDDVAILGVHDIDMSRHLIPPLSSVRIPRREIGREAALALCARFENPDYTQSLDLGFEIIERGTS